MESGLSRIVMQRLRSTLPAAADPVRAASQSAYMRHQFTYLGITMPRLTELSREVLAGLAKPDEDDLLAVARACWQRDEREYQYFACSYLRRHIKVCSAAAIDTARHLVVTKSWWDTVDTLAADTVGPLVAAHPELLSTMDAWSADANMWLVRTAILHQLRFKRTTDTERLFGYCTAQAGHTDFFIRKAVGWALREYAKTDPVAVRAFVAAHTGILSGLSTREALKNIG
jgi:3-methyladenine DNA glycosylase AlkD